MAFQCEPQHTFGYDFCITRCPSIATGVFEQIRVEREADQPAADPRALDIAILDMNHGWPNVGHDAIVMGVQTIACDIREALLASRLRVRAISYDVRRGLVIPPKPASGGIYVGTGGPGHLDPRQNDGLRDGSQGIQEDPAWESSLFALFDAIHTVDRAKIAAALAEEIARQGRRPRLFVEINTGGEAQKAGVLPEAADAFIGECRERYRLTIEGLMCIPPFDEPPAPHFALVQKIARRNGLAALSMGMSADFQSAIAFGATHVRVGSAIFGARR